jgi:ribose transport system substrate-binding protein
MKLKDPLSRMVGLCTVFIVATALTGCKPSVETKPVASARPRVALVMKSLANEFFLSMENGAKAHQQAHSGEYDLLAKLSKF